MRYVIRPDVLSAFDVVTDPTGGAELTPTPVTAVARYNEPTVAAPAGVRIVPRTPGGASWVIPLRGQPADWDALADAVFNACRPEEHLSLAQTLYEARTRTSR